MNSFSLNLQESFMGKCLFCRKVIHKKDYHYSEEKDCLMGEMCIDCAKLHKKHCDRAKDPRLSIVDSVCNPSYKPTKHGNSTGLF